MRKAADKQLLAQILQDGDPVFVRWAVDRLLHWDNPTRAERLLHIHGTADRILPYRFVDCDISLEEGSHMLPLGKYEDLNRILLTL